MERTAHLHIDNLDGWTSGLARCYKLSDQHSFGGRHVAEYVVVSVSPPSRHHHAQVSVVPATEAGSALGGSVRQHDGSYTPKGNPFDDQAHLEGCFVWGLGMAGYEVVDAPEPEPVADPEPKFENGLDYDPSVIPE